MAPQGNGISAPSPQHLARGAMSFRTPSSAPCWKTWIESHQGIQNSGHLPRGMPTARLGRCSAAANPSRQQSMTAWHATPADWRPTLASSCEVQTPLATLQLQAGWRARSALEPTACSSAIMREMHLRPVTGPVRNQQRAHV